MSPSEKGSPRGRVLAEWLFTSLLRLAAVLSSRLCASFPEHACTTPASPHAAGAHLVAWPSVEAREEAAGQALAQLSALGWRAGDSPDPLPDALTVTHTLSKQPPPAQLAGSVWRLRALRVALPARRPFALGWPLVDGYIAYQREGAAMATVHRVLLQRNAYAGPWAAAEGTVAADGGSMTILHHALVNQGGSRTEAGLFGGAGPGGGNVGGTRTRSATLCGDRLFLSLAAADGVALCLCWQRVQTPQSI